ncbi:hypothetical protein E5K00_12340 [Hymenobacter aquaticus]|uniref:DUF4907 domain-containing protein n=1 Tax=Hymenobacter aquaticus TaxID=1867101 RepID=A0A4Z0QA60_9BACT|nr:hypothetical protein [Hymenobacter aquaticus]TGE25941.1 hypothetical protein E5K00_12340 [Hymenobacter aquaticus]
MKRCILICSITAAGWLSSVPTQAQTTSGTTAIVRVRESNGWGNVIVTYGTGKTEIKELKRNPDKKGQIANAEQLQAVIDQLFASGYVLQGSFSAGSEDGPSTLIFRKP